MNGQKICILVDSGCDVPQAVRQAYDMRVLPLKIRYPEGEYDDQVNITAQQVYDRFPGEIPQTSLPDGGTIHDALDRARADGYEKALVICISSGLSGTYNMVRLVCQEYQSMETFVLDTRNISFGSGVFALLAAHWIAGGMDWQDLQIRLVQRLEDSKVFFCVDTLEYLRKGGRLGLVAAIVGNVLGYTLLKQYMADMYYGSYSLPTYVTHWNGDAFVKTTVVPLILMFCINLLVLVNKMSLSPLKFLRRDLKRRQKKKAFKLNTKIGILKRFRLRVIFQNMPNYVTIIIGVLFANFLLLFGFMFGPLLDHYQEEITSNLICQYQYVLKAPQETDTPGAEKYSVASLKTVDDKRKSEDVTVYGVVPDSAYLDLNFDGGVVISNAYAEKFGLSAGDTLRVKEAYGDKEYSFPIKGVHYYPAGIAVFMEQSAFHSTFDQSADAFNGYFSNQKITDIEDLYVATTITVDDMTKTSRQLKQSMGNMMVLFLVFGVAMFMLIVYLLSKIILEKNAQSISMTKILGYSNREINSLYITTTSLVVISSMLLTIPLCAYLMKTVCVYIFSDYSGWFAYYVPLTVYVKMFLLGVCSYLAVAYLQTRSIKGVPLGEALKNVE